MFEIDKKNFKKKRKPGIIIVIIGIIVIGICGFVLFSAESQKSKMDRETTATDFTEDGYYDDDGNYMYTPTFFYTVKGEQYSCKSRVSSSSIPSENTTIYYNSKNPSECLSSYELSGNWMLYIFLGLGGIILVWGCVMIIGSNKALKKAKLLSKNGKLIKNMPYRLEGTNTYINGYNVKKLVVDYIMPNGLTKTLVGDARYDLKTKDEDGLVDLLIDPNDADNYYIDFDIKYSEGAPVEFYSGPIPENNQTEPVMQNIENVVQEQQAMMNNSIQPQQEIPITETTPPIQEPVVNNQNNDLQDLFNQNAPVDNTNINNQQ